jgi:Sugar kinases, ribokinase family
MDIIGVGDSGVDLILEIEAMPERGNKCRARELAKNPGGMIGNFCTAAAKLGMNCGVVSAVGNDGYGQIVTDDYRKNGIDIANLMVVNDAATFYAVVLLDKEGEKYLFTVDTPLLSPPLERIDINYLWTAKYVHLNSMDHDLAAYAIHSLRDSAVNISLDYEIHADKPGLENWGALFKEIEVLFINQAAIESLFKENFQTIDTAARSLLTCGMDTVVVTCAEKGGYVFSREEAIRYEAVVVEKVADTTGAGDCFNAAFLSARIRGLDLQRSAQTAAVAAALSIQKVGAREGQPTLQELESALSKAF